LDVKEGRVYISRDVIFDETVFPFASLHPNAGARLRSEILLLPNHLKNPHSFGSGEEQIRDTVMTDFSPANLTQDRATSGDISGFYPIENGRLLQHAAIPAAGAYVATSTGVEDDSAASSD